MDKGCPSEKDFLARNGFESIAAVALQALFRRDQFERSDRVELFAELASFFRGKVEFPAEATEGVADEQYLRNVVDVIYRTGEKKPAT